VNPWLVVAEVDESYRFSVLVLMLPYAGDAVERCDLVALALEKTSAVVCKTNQNFSADDSGCYRCADAETVLASSLKELLAPN